MEQTRLCTCPPGQELADPCRWARLEEVIAAHRGEPGALIQVLHAAQNIFGYLPLEVQERVADGLGIPLGEVYGVVTFYSFFTMVPRGEHTIRVCLGTACYVRGGREVLNQLKAHLGIEVQGTTADREFSLEVVRCVGACGLAPVMTVDGDVYRRVKPARAVEVLEKYRKKED
jgi:NADH:ubiquinone oxidoreductase subunit E